MLSAATELLAVETLQPAWPLAAQVCVLTRHQVVRLGNLRHESALRWRVRKTCPRALPGGGFVFELTTLAYRQTPTSGPGQLAAALAPVLATLVVETDATGRVVRVSNKSHLQEKWARLLPDLQARYRHDPAMTPAVLEQLGQVVVAEGALEALLATSPEYGLLLPALYGQPLSTRAPHPGTAVLARFVGDLDLPLRTEALLTATAQPGVAAQVAVAGEVDAAHYRAADVGQRLRALLDAPRLDARVLAVHHEEYCFGSQHELRTARRHTRAEISGLVSHQLTVLLDTEPGLLPADDSSLTAAARYE